MDLLSVMRERVSDQHSAQRQLRTLYAANTTVALLLLGAAYLLAPCFRVKEDGVGDVAGLFDLLYGSNMCWTAIFLAAQVAGYVFLCRGLATLNANRLLPTPVNMGGGQSLLKNVLLSDHLGSSRCRVLLYSLYITGIIAVPLALWRVASPLFSCAEVTLLVLYFCCSVKLLCVSAAHQ